MITIQLRYKDGILTDRYPFKELINVGDEMLFENGITPCVQQAAYSYGRKHGTKYFTKCLGKSMGPDAGMDRTYIRRIK